MGTALICPHSRARQCRMSRGLALCTLAPDDSLLSPGWLRRLAGIGFASLCNTYFIPRPRSPDSSPRRLPVSKANSDNAHAHSQCIVDDPPQRVRKVVATRESRGSFSVAAFIQDVLWEPRFRDAKRRMSRCVCQSAPVRALVGHGAVREASVPRILFLTGCW